MPTQDGFYQVAAAGEREGEGPARRRPTRGHVPQSDIQTKIYNTVDTNFPQGWRIDNEGYRHLDRTEIRSVPGSFLPNGGEYAVVRHSGSNYLYVVVAEYNSNAPALIVPIEGPSIRPGLVAARALEYRRVAEEYFHRTGIQEANPPAKRIREDDYIAARENDISRMLEQLRRLEVNAPEASRTLRGGGRLSIIRCKRVTQHRIRT